MIEFPKYSNNLRSKTLLEKVYVPLSVNVRFAASAKRNLLYHSNDEIYSALEYNTPTLMALQHTLKKHLAESMQKGKTSDFDEALYLIHCICKNEETATKQKLLGEVQTIIGTNENNLKQLICELVNKIVTYLDDDEIQLQPNSMPENLKNSLKSCWGSEIRLYHVVFKFNNVNVLQYISFDSVSNEINLSKFSLSLKTQENKLNEKLLKICDLKTYKKVLNLLNSKKQSHEIQNDLCELIGLENIDLSYNVLANRESFSDKLSFNREKHNESKTSIGARVKSLISESANQKNNTIKTRKHDNKYKFEESLTNRINTSHKSLDSVREQHVSNPETKINRENVFIPPDRPYVFDSQLSAKQTAAFIGGSKISLPESAQRVDTKQFEEIKIPSIPSHPLTMKIQKIQIKDLDNIGKLVFRHCEQLNLVQSVVFPTAYYSNNNMLICAPTGAGKTNVAMLTIVSVIKSHCENGVINRDAFKIVYVAPMKALASEMVDHFEERLKPLHINVRELTGDMRLTKAEMQKTQILVTTPEKWDVVTRKGVGDVAITSLVKLLIIDEVHLLHGDRGPIIEALIARTLRMVESSQTMIRIVGLSATLPNYIDVANFLRVDPRKGLFYFDSRFRPVPLDTNFVGIKAVKPVQQLTDMDSVCYSKCFEEVQKDNQVLVFVHARNATVKTAMMLKETAQQKNQSSVFVPKNALGLKLAISRVSKSKNRQLVDLFNSGISIHHAGMLRTDRRLVEQYFKEGYIRVLVCTSTLAWGVNLPAHAVIIKGTDIYDSKHGAFVDIGILDVLQIFGRAGRPQYDTRGVGTIITKHEKLNHYLCLLNNQFPIESNFINCLADNLNAEIASGTVTNIDEAVEWLSYTYLFVRMRINPLCYGIDYKEIDTDPSLENKRRALITIAAVNLDKAKMIRYNIRTNNLNATELGRTASHFYIKYDTVEIFNELLKPFMTEADILNMISQAQEFHQLKVRDDEMDELDELRYQVCKLPCHGGLDDVPSKVNTLLQTYLSRGYIKSFSLVSDMTYIIQNVVRIARALFTIVLRNNNAILAGRMLQISQMFERQMWNTDTPLRQFNCLPHEIFEKIESRGISVYTLKEMDFQETKNIFRNQKLASILLQCAKEFPVLETDVSLHPISRTVIRLNIDLWSNFDWNDRIHGKISENFWIWIEDPETNYIYHSEYLQMPRKKVLFKEKQSICLTIPLREPHPSQYFVRITSENWLGSKTVHPINLKNLILPEQSPALSELLQLRPLPISALKSSQFMKLYSFTHFNPIQTQIFHNLYHTDNNILLGAPTGSGKTIVAEIAILRVFQKSERAKVVYIAPLKALVRERIKDWKLRFEKKLGKTVVELTGDSSPDIAAIERSQIIVTTPEKWDSISRSWQTREYVKNIVLIIIDEIQLLGEDRGPVIEVIVSRTNYITSNTKKSIRIIGLSTAVSNARDLAGWLGIHKNSLYNFKPSVRPVPLSVHISGFSGKNYCPRMATMNRPAYQAIRTYSPSTPAIVFVSSRRQTRLTALDLITYMAGEENPKQFLNTSDIEINKNMLCVSDADLKFCMAFGIGLHHAGLSENDRSIVEDLFLNRKIQILVATATLAWGVNLPAHLVVIKGTEYFDSKTKKYVDMPITDVLQMMGRAGRPQFDNEGVAVVFVHDEKKTFYKKFLYDPFPVESCLLNVLPDHINAEIVSGTVQTKESAVEFLTWTYLFRRILNNPTYYKLKSVDPMDINNFLSSLIETCLMELEGSACISISKNQISPTFLGRISSFYYISHKTMKHFLENVKSDMSTRDLLITIADAYEFNQQPVRHNENLINEELAKRCRYKTTTSSYDSPHTKTYLLLQAHIMRLPLPNSDYLTDTKSVLDQTLRVLQALMDYVAERGWLSVTLKLQLLSQSVIQARWCDEPIFLMLPNVTDANISYFYKTTRLNQDELCLPRLKELCKTNFDLLEPLKEYFDDQEIKTFHQIIQNLPELSVDIQLQQNQGDNQRFIRRINTEQSDWCDVTANETYVINVRLVCDSSIVYCPKYPKAKDVGWFLTLGSQTNNELLAMKRVTTVRGSATERLCFQAPPSKARLVLCLYIFSDCYIGIDQQFEIKLNII